MTYFERLLKHYGYTNRDFYDKCKEFRPNLISYRTICNLCSSNPKPIDLEKLKYIALVLGCSYLDLITGAGEYHGLQVKI